MIWQTDLCFYYKKSIDGVEEVNRKAWELYRDSSSGSDNRIKLLALRLAKECNEAMFSLFQSGPSVLNMKSLEERLNKTGQINRQTL